MQWLKPGLKWLRGAMLLVVILGLISCKQLPNLDGNQGPIRARPEQPTGLKSLIETSGSSDRASANPSKALGTVPSPAAVVEVSPPAVIQDLRPVLDQLHPQVTILTPTPESLLQDDQVSVSFKVEDLPVFRDPDLGMGPHLDVSLDDEPDRGIYDLTEPLVLKGLKPGTHTIRAVASYPWSESFKNIEAYDQVTFHVFTQTQASPNSTLPLLTYGSPQGDYGAEPILLDFFVSSGTDGLEPQAGQNSDMPANWQVQVTVNGFSFEMDAWKPLYLKGFKPGKNWVRLALLDERGEPIPNRFNDTVRLVTLNPDGEDYFSQLVRGDLNPATARGIVDPNYTPPAPTPDAPFTPEDEFESLSTPPPMTAEPRPMAEPDLMDVPVSGATSQDRASQPQESAVSSSTDLTPTPDSATSFSAEEEPASLEQEKPS